MKKVVCIISDALCNDYGAEFDLQYLKSIKRKIEKIYPSTGYCEIVEYVTGKESHEHFMLTQLNAVESWQNRKTPVAVYIINGLLQNRFWRIPKVRAIHKKFIYPWVTRLLSNFFDKDLLNVRYNVPLPFLCYFEPIESKFEYDSYDFGGDEQNL